MLSKYNPIGILIYGNAEIIGTPWELIIKEYRKKLGSKKFDTVRLYALDFIKYLNLYFSADDQLIALNGNLTSYFTSVILAKIDSRIKSVTNEKEKISRIEINRIVDNSIQTTYLEIQGKENLDGIPKNYCNTLLIKYDTEIDKVIDDVFKELPITSRARNRLRFIGANVFCKAVFPNDISGAVIAGFGDKGKFPAVFAITVDQVVNNHLKYKIINEAEISFEQPAWIIPFAQHEMVITFIEGVDPDFNNLLEGYLTEIFNEYPNVLVESLPELIGDKKKELVENLQKQGNEILSSLKTELKKFKKMNNIDRIVTMVEYLPKDELAAMAESLVSLTSFKRRMSLDAETVGGPIDVAVISKGDGFVWIKRKQYFKPELNPHFLANYYRDCN
jgi:hypothetical protein